MTTRPKRYSLAVELTSYCNQKCSYCYNGWREDGGRSVGALAAGDLGTLLDRALTEVAFDHVTLTGGEPFARKDIFDLIEIAHQHGAGVQIISNGGLITAELAERLAPYRVYYVQVAVNGPEPELHEAHSGKGTWLPMMRGIRALNRHGVPISGCIVVTKKNHDRVGETLDLLASLGVKLVALSRFSPAGYASEHVAELLPSRSELLVALEASEARAQQHGMSIQVTMPVPQCVVDHADYPNIRFGGCPIGTEMQEFALGPRGELRNCTLHEAVIGDAHEESFATLVESPAVMAYRDVTPEFCEPCPLKSSCLGGCGAAAHWVLGEGRRLDPFVAQHVDDAFAARLAELRA